MFTNSKNTNTELSIDLKLVTRKPGLMPIGAILNGSLTHDREYHYLFIECASERKKSYRRTPLVYSGKRVNVHIKDDGTLFTTLNRPQFNNRFTFIDYCVEAAAELLLVADLLGKEKKC